SGCGKRTSSAEWTITCAAGSASPTCRRRCSGRRSRRRRCPRQRRKKPLVVQPGLAQARHHRRRSGSSPTLRPKSRLIGRAPGRNTVSTRLCRCADSRSVNGQESLMDQTLLLWGGFVAFVVAMLALDIGVFHRRPHVVGMREALTWTGVWIALALAFNAGVWYWFGTNAALEF